MGSRVANIELAHKNTCDWLFETAGFVEWTSRKSLQTHNGVLWIKGHPGVGKSTLMKHTLLHCQEKFQNHIISFYGFNARGANALERSPMGMLRSIMAQLLEQNSSLWNPVMQKFTNKNNRHGICHWEYGELKDIFLMQYTSHHVEQCIILIDALDECDISEVEHVVAFLEALSHNATNSQSKMMICLSSRHYPSIDMEKKIELVVEEQHGHDQDIVGYVGQKLKTKDQTIQHDIIQKARHIFIWVVLVVEILNREHLKGKGNLKAMKKKLNEIPSDLDQLFSKILNGTQSGSDKEATVLLFLWVLFSTRTLNPEELYLAVLAGTELDEIDGTPNGPHTDYATTKLFINNTSMGLVETVPKPNYGNAPGKMIFYDVQFIHQSVVDFLTRNQRLLRLDPTLRPSIIGACHHRLAVCCQAYMQSSRLSSSKGSIVWDYERH